MKKKKYAVINEDEYLFGTNNVASANECTGIAPSDIKNESEAQSYKSIYDIPVKPKKKSKKEKNGD